VYLLPTTNKITRNFVGRGCDQSKDSYFNTEEPSQFKAWFFFEDPKFVKITGDSVLMSSTLAMPIKSLKHNH